MKEKIKKDILNILNQVIEIIEVKEERDITELKDLSDHTIHNSSVFQDEDSVCIAVVIYAISKIIYRKKGDIPKEIIIEIVKARDCLKNNQFESYRAAIKGLFRKISRIDDRSGLYIQEVIKQGEIKKGSRLYEHGISMAQAAYVLGISTWELMNYVGKTRIADISYEKTGVRQRMKFARGLFK